MLFFSREMILGNAKDHRGGRGLYLGGGSLEKKNNRMAKPQDDTRDIFDLQALIVMSTKSLITQNTSSEAPVTSWKRMAF